MPTPLDLTRWPRRAAFEHYRRYDNPYFSVCTRVDIAGLARAIGGRASLAMGWHYLALEIANALEPFRLRIDGGGVVVHEQIDGSTTVLRDDGAFGFATLRRTPGFAAFAAAARREIAAARAGELPFDPDGSNQAMVYFTSLPAVHFTSFSHARQWGREDSVPRFAFGRIADEGGRRWLPVAIEVHHALMDGVHLGEFVERFEAALAAPDDWL